MSSVSDRIRATLQKHRIVAVRPSSSSAPVLLRCFQCGVVLPDMTGHLAAALAKELDPFREPPKPVEQPVRRDPRESQIVWGVSDQP